VGGEREDQRELFEDKRGEDVGLKCLRMKKNM